MMSWSWRRSSTSTTKLLMPAPVLGHRDLGLGDVAVARGDGAGDLGQQPGPVVADVDGDPDRALGRLLHVPLHGDEPLAVQHALGHGEAVAGVHGEPAAAGDEAHDGVAGHRVAALGEARRAGRRRRGSARPASAGGRVPAAGFAPLRPRRAWPPAGRACSAADGPRSCRSRGRPAGRRRPGTRGRRPPCDISSPPSSAAAFSRYFLASRSNISRPSSMERAALLDLEPLVDLGAGPRRT